jgi:cobalt-zinc-cadmium efflux system protein
MGDPSEHLSIADRASQSAEQRAENRRRLGLTLGLAASYMVAEVVGGLWTGSLALLADAGHMASDVAALVLSLFALWIAQRPADARRTFGHTRAEILAALGQGTALVAVALMVVLEALERLAAPTQVAAPGMLAIASGGLVVNLAGLWILNRGRQHSLNVRGAWLHVLSDALGSLGAMAAGAAIWAFGWAWADPAASMAICLLILFSAWHLLREAVDVLMETAPRHLDVEEIQSALASSPEILEVHDLHVWTIGSGEVSLSSHVVARDGSETAQVLGRIHELLSTRFGIHHTTIQVEPQDFAGSSSDTEPGCAGACNPAIGEAR